MITEPKEVRKILRHLVKIGWGRPAGAVRRCDAQPITRAGRLPEYRQKPAGS